MSKYNHNKHCVYCISNDVDDYVYIGITCDFEFRKKQHFQYKKTEEQIKKNLLYQHMELLGQEHFTMKILCDDIKYIKEAKYIETQCILLAQQQNRSLNQALSCSCNASAWKDGCMQYGTETDVIIPQF